MEPMDSDTLVLPPPVKPAFVDTCKDGMVCIEEYVDSTGRGMSHFMKHWDRSMRWTARCVSLISGIPLLKPIS